MSDEKKTAPKNALDEKTLEGIAGGGFTMPPPVLSIQCPCGAKITYESSMDRVQCTDCGRWFWVINGMLIEEKQG